ncbi:Cacna1c [Symbiodinium pilosum]|uniref:Cacna1c protein n=1 Tax=Symbiodinium pilosum TaxID=2952 RepID=A0A812RME4_SYMPI|nr:Cacna1c [Symbiodinium pilosum]
MAAFGRGFFTDAKNLAWNITDLIIVASALVEVFVQVTLSMLDQDAPPGVSTLTNMRVLRIIRITRLVRLTRIARITRFIKALRTLVSSIVFTLKSLVWALVLLSLIIYGFGIVFTQAATLYVMDLGADGSVDESDPTLLAINEYWHDLPGSMLTLFMAICGGVSWENALRPMGVVSGWCAFLFLFYISFCYFAVLNVVTGVFCQSAIESAQSDHEMIMQNIMQNKEAHIRKVRSLFSNLDADESGYISLVELEQNMHKKSVRTYFEALELDVSDAWTFFKLLDTDGGSAIEIEESLDAQLAVPLAWGCWCAGIRSTASEPCVAVWTSQVPAGMPLLRIGME